MKVGTLIILLVFVLIGFGYLLSDNMQLNQELALASEQQMRTLEEIESLHQRTSLVRQELIRAASEQERLNLEIQLASLEVQLMRQQNLLLTQSGEKMTFGGRIMLTGYVDYEENNLGRVILTYPESISLGDSEAVVLTLIPNNTVYSKSPSATMYENTEGLSVDLPDTIEISPIMTAKISGVGFDIMENAIEQAVNPEAPTEWVWTVSGKDEGRHILVANIAVPLTIDGNQELVDANVHLYPVEIEVVKPLKSWLNGLLPYILPAIMTGIISYYVGARKLEYVMGSSRNKNGEYVKLSIAEREVIKRLRRKT